MAEERGYISGSEFVPSPNGRYVRNTDGTVTDSRSGRTSGASYDYKATEPEPEYKGESFIALATGSNLMSHANPTIKPIIRNGQIVGVEDKALQQSYAVKKGTTIKDLRRIENARAGYRIVQAIELQKEIQKSQMQGVVRANTPQTLRQKLDNFYNRQQTAISREQMRGGRGYASALFRGTVVLGAVGVARGLYGVADTVFHPVQTAKSTFQAIRHPVQFIQSEGERFRVDPVGVVVEYYTFSKTMGGVIKTAKRSPVGRYVLEEIYIQQQPKELRQYVRAIIKSSEVQRKINPYKIENIRKVDFAEVKALNKVEAKAISRAIRQTDTVIFGSLASRTLSKKRTPIPKDVDLATANIQKFSRTFINNLPSKIRKNYVLKGQKVVRKSNGMALFDVKPISRLYPDKSLFTKRGFLPVSGYVKKVGFKKGSYLPKLKRKVVSGALEIPTSKKVKLKGFKLVGFGEQTLRKGLGTLQVLIEKNSRRAKDPQGFIRGLQVQIEGLKRSRPSTKIGRALKKSRIKRLQSALDILSSKKFARILNKKIPGLTREFPLIAKIDAKKLRRAEKLPRARVKALANQRAKKEEKYSRKSSRRSSRLPKSRGSRLPSRIPRRSRASRLPSRSRRSTLPASRRSSRLPKSRSSKLARSRSGRSGVPKSGPSSIPASRLKASKLPKSMLRGLGASKLRALKFKFSPTKVKLFRRLNKSKLLRKKIVKELRRIPKRYRPNLEAVIFNIVAKKRPGKITGLEIRPIIRAMAQAKSKRLKVSRRVKRVRRVIARRGSRRFIRRGPKRSRRASRSRVRRIKRLRALKKRRVRRSKRRSSRRINRKRSRRVRHVKRRKSRRTSRRRRRKMMGMFPSSFRM